MVSSKIHRSKIRRSQFRSCLLSSIALNTLLASACTLGTLTCNLGVAIAQDSSQAHDWNRPGPMRAIGLQPKQIKPPAPMPLALPTPMPAQLPTQLPEFESTIQLASGNDETPSSVVSALATSADRQPSIVKIPALKVDLPVVQNQTAQDMATSRSIGAKVRLSAGSFITSDAVNSGVASLPGQSNSSNIKVTRSGDITAETPVKLSFNADQVVALPAFPSANSPYAKSGIEIPVRVETVTNTINTLHGIKSM